MHLLLGRIAHSTAPFKMRKAAALVSLAAALLFVSAAAAAGLEAPAAAAAAPPLRPLRPLPLLGRAAALLPLFSKLFKGSRALFGPYYANHPSLSGCSPGSSAAEERRQHKQQQHRRLQQATLVARPGGPGGQFATPFFGSPYGLGFYGGRHVGGSRWSIPVLGAIGVGEERPAAERKDVATPTVFYG